jgi:predicted RND superfamily exporter protein
MLILLDGFVMSGIKVKSIQWNAFLPKTASSENNTNILLDKQKQYLFCKTKEKQKINALIKKGLVEESFEIPLVNNACILLFDAKKMNELLSQTQQFQRSGTVLLGRMVFEDFFEEINDYTFKIVPIVLVLLLFLIPLRLWVDILLEMAIYTVLLALVLRLDIIEINSASLLSLVFLIVYSLTLINYLYSEGMEFKRLFLGIQISIVATMVSALFLIYSNFGLIHSFGVMLLLGLIVLHLYMNIRIYLTKYFSHSHHEHRFEKLLKHTFLKKYKKLFVFAFLALLTTAFSLKQNFSIDLNIVNLLPTNSESRAEITAFEKEVFPSLPFVISIATKEKNFADIKQADKLFALEKEIEKESDLKTVESFSRSFGKFKNMAKDKNNPDLLAQFLLANSFMSHKFELFSSDMADALMVVSIPLSTSSGEIISLKEKIISLSKQYPDFRVNIKGKVADFDKYLVMFMQEFSIGLFATLLLNALFFLLYCKNLLSTLIIFVSVAFSLSLLVSMHILFGKPLSLLTLMSIILYAGLIADSLIQLFICYKSSQTQCERTVLHPVFVSNAAILIFLFGMLFVDGILASFAFDMSILLTSNLIFMIWIIPYIHQKYPKVCSG